MNHPSEDKLLAYALGILEDASEGKEIEKHLEDCGRCGDNLDKIKSDVDIIAGVKGPIIPLPSKLMMKPRRIGSNLMKIAALLLLGFLTGYAVANLIRPRQVNVTPSYLVLAAPADSLIGLGISDATEVGGEYQ